MAGFDDPAFYGDRWAGIYDEHYAALDPAAAVEFLAGWAGSGRVLELAIGTGRVAVPLAGRGIRVEGVDASAAMVERLRDARARRRAVQWLADNSLIDDDSADRFLDRHPEPALP